MKNLSFFSDQDITVFPDSEKALLEPYDGLLAIGGNLSCETLINAYQKGIFPWFNEGEPIMWWSPSKRAMIYTHQIHISKTMKKLMSANRYRILVDHNFFSIITHCANREETWISSEMISAYVDLYKQGIAHSVEVYDGKSLIGGLYGVFIKNIFCGESMFSLKPNASKLALISLAQFLHKNNCQHIDCQMPTSHLETMGAKTISRINLLQYLNQNVLNTRLEKKQWNILWQ